MKVKPRGIEIPLIILLVGLSIFVIGAIGIVIYRLGQSGVFEQGSVAQTNIVSTTTLKSAENTTDALTKATTVAQTSTTEAAAKTTESQKKTETTTSDVKETETTTEAVTTTKETKTDKTNSTKKTNTTKTDAKADDTSATTTAEEKSAFTLYQEYVRDVLIPKYGMSPHTEEKGSDEGRGIASAVIRDFNQSGEIEMLIVRLETYNSYYAPYPIFELYGIKNKQVTLLSDAACQYPMSEWSLRYEGACVYLSGVQADVGASEEDIRINQIDIDVTRHFLMAVRDSYTIGVPEGPEKSYSEDALWVCEITNRLADANRGNEGRVYTMLDYTDMRSWAT